MNKKTKQFIILCASVLFVLYAISLGVYLSYRVTIKREVKQAQELPTTDLSLLSFNGYRVGEDFYLIPHEAAESIPSNLFLTFEDGEVYRLVDIYGGEEAAGSRIVKIAAIIYEGSNTTAYYNDAAIPNQKRLEDFFGDGYIEVSKYGKPVLRVYIDQVHNLQLTVEVRHNTENGYINFEELPPDYYDHVVLESNVDGWHWSYNPIGVMWGTVQKLQGGCSIFRTTDVVLNGFNNSQLVILPLYYFLLLLPILALIVYRTKKLMALNVLLPLVYIIWFLAMILGVRV